jgi:hypothetical protein
MGKNPQQGDATEPISAADVLSALNRSGYPLEIRLWKVLNEVPHARTMFNPRVAVGPDGARREVDLVTNFYEWAPHDKGTGEGLDYKAFIRLLLEAKGMARDEAFVGLRLKGRDPEAEEPFNGFPRCYLAGYPSSRVLRRADAGTNTIMNTSVPDCMAPLHDGANVCVQWATIKQSGNPRVSQPANHDPLVHEALDTLVQAARNFETYYTRVVLKRPRLTVVASLTALVVPNDRLFEVDIDTQEVRPTSWLILRRPFEVEEMVEDRLIDVFEERALPAMIERYSAMLTALRAAVRANEAELLEAGAEDAASLRERAR